MVKLINNAVAAANAHTLAQALVVGRATGIDLDALAQVMGAGSGGSAMLALKAGPMREHDYATLFKLEHMLKDVRLCLEEGQAAGVPFPAAAAVREALTARHGPGSGRRRLRRASSRRSRASPASAFRRAHTTVHRSLHAVCSFGAQRCAIAPFRSHPREESVSRGADVVPRRHRWQRTAPFDRSSAARVTAALRERSAPSRDAGEPVVRARLARSPTAAGSAARRSAESSASSSIRPEPPIPRAFCPSTTSPRCSPTGSIRARWRAGASAGWPTARAPASPAATSPTAASSATRSSAASSSRTCSTSTCRPAARTPSSTSAFPSSCRRSPWRAAYSRRSA